MGSVSLEQLVSLYPLNAYTKEGGNFGHGAVGCLQTYSIFVALIRVMLSKNPTLAKPGGTGS